VFDIPQVYLCESNCVFLMTMASNYINTEMADIHSVYHSADENTKDTCCLYQVRHISNSYYIVIYEFIQSTIQ
jgi:hypothetical protein